MRVDTKFRCLSFDDFLYNHLEKNGMRPNILHPIHHRDNRDTYLFMLEKILGVLTIYK